MSHQMSPEGREFLAHHEGGHVLKAYLDSAGVWTIGVGLTAASGVVKPHAGMVITRQESDRLLALALPKYERGTRAAMGPHVKQCEFDGGASFHFNTGAIHKASWVQALIQNQRDDAEKRLMLWNKAGGKELRGLTNRRAAEANLIFRGVYKAANTHTSARVARHDPGQRQPVLRKGSTGTAVAQLQEELRTLGYYEGTATGQFADYTEMAVRKFQRAHPHLTEDGIAGAATMAQIQRNIDARRKAKSTTIGGAASGATTGGGNEALGGADVTAIPTELLIAGVAGFIVVLLFVIAWQYREVIQQRIRRD